MNAKRKEIKEKNKMFIKIYDKLVETLYPFVIHPYIQKRLKNGKEDTSRHNERLGEPKLPRPQGKLIWFHGASVGESLSMLPLIHKLLDENKDYNIMVTTGTITSAELMAKRLPPRAFHQYIPIDNPKFVKSFIQYWQPDIALWFESEFWPAMLGEIKKNNIPLILVNGRISNKTFKRWKLFSFVSKELLSCFKLCLGQSDEDARRLKIIGAKKALCLGNLKYAGFNPPVDKEKKADILAQIGQRPTWGVISTHNDEEAQIGKKIAKIKAQIPNLLTIVTPRHPQRGNDIQQQLNALGLKTALRTKQEKIMPETDVYIADTIGEVGIWYDITPIVFIGGSLIPHGGQNFIEPCRFHDAVLVGPFMHNFTDAMNRAKKANAVIQVKNTEQLSKEVLKLLQDKEYLQTYQEKAYEWATSEAKVLDGISDVIKEYL